MKTTMMMVALMISSLGYLDAETFHKSKLVGVNGRDASVELGFDRDTRKLTVKTPGRLIADIPYANIDKMSYELSSRRRVKEGAIVMIASLGAGGVVMLTKSRSHWLYIDYKNDKGEAADITLKLDKGEYQGILEAAREQTGRTVDTVNANGDAERKRQK